MLGACDKPGSAVGPLLGTRDLLGGEHPGQPGGLQKPSSRRHCGPLVVRRSVGDCGHEGYTHIAENKTELTPPLHFESCRRDALPDFCCGSRSSFEAGDQCDLLKSSLTIRSIGGGGRSVLVLIPSIRRDAFFGRRGQEDQCWRAVGSFCAVAASLMRTAQRTGRAVAHGQISILPNEIGDTRPASGIRYVSLMPHAAKNESAAELSLTDGARRLDLPANAELHTIR